MYSPLPIALGRGGGRQAGEFVNTKEQKIFAIRNVLIKHKWTRIHKKTKSFAAKVVLLDID